MAFKFRTPGRSADPAAVGQLARLLAVAWAQPDERLASGLLTRAWQDDVAQAVAGLTPVAAGLASAAQTAEQIIDRAITGADATGLAVALGAEYAALFQGPGRALVGAYECQWLDSPDATLFVAPSTLAVEAAYRSAGLGISTHEPPDSLAVELEFVGRLAATEASSAKSDAIRWRGQRVQFVAAHPAVWIDPFCQAVAQATEHGVYAALAQLTREVNRSGVLTK